MVARCHQWVMAEWMFLFPASGSIPLFRPFLGWLWRVCYLFPVLVARFSEDGRPDRQINRLIGRKVSVSLANAATLYFWCISMVHFSILPDRVASHQLPVQASNLYMKLCLSISEWNRAPMYWMVLLGRDKWPVLVPNCLLVPVSVPGEVFFVLAYYLQDRRGTIEIHLLFSVAGDLAGVGNRHSGKIITRSWRYRAEHILHT